MVQSFVALGFCSLYGFLISFSLFKFLVSLVVFEILLKTAFVGRCCCLYFGSIKLSHYAIFTR